MSLLIDYKLAWRNILRNKRRTLLAGIAVGLGLASLIFVDALMIGMEHNMIDAATASFMGDGQIHRKQFRKTGEVELTIDSLGKVIEQLEDEEIVEHYTVRTITFGMISSPSNVSSVSMVGIDAETEPDLSEIDEAMIEGEYLSGNDSHEILIGSKLAELLEIELGDRVVLTAAQAETGDLAQEMFRIKGIFHFNVQTMDQHMAFVGIDMTRQMLALDDGAHQIAIKFSSRDIGRKTDHPFWSSYTTETNEAVGWTELLPQLEIAFELSQFSTLLVAVILFGLVALGIINTLFMSLYERMFEFGVLRAIGTHPFAMGRMIIFEAGALAVVSVVIGSIIGWLVISITQYTGIDYTGIEFAGVTFRRLLYPVLEVKQFTVFPFWVFVFTVCVALYPATYAARLQPARAMKRSF